MRATYPAARSFGRVAAVLGRVARLAALVFLAVGFAADPAAAEGDTVRPAAISISGDPRPWSAEFDIQGVDGEVRTLLVQPDGLWIGGDFTLAGDRLAHHVVRFDGDAWRDLGSFDDRVSVFALHEGQVVAGGRFRSADGADAPGIAIANGAGGWNALGAGFEHRGDPERCEVRALVSFEGRLYAGGEFTHAGGEEAPSLAVWDGERWGPVAGGPLAGPFLSVETLAVYGDGIVVGGEFDTAGELVSPSLVAWRDGSWTSLGGGLGGKVHAAREWNGSLVVGGFFRIRDREVPLDNFAVWDGESWTSWDSEFGGIDPRVLTIDEFRGDLIVGGEFGTIRGARYEQVARWDGSDWQRMSGGFVGTGGVFDLVNWGSTLVAGGEFSNASGHSGWGLARWGGSSWNPIGVGHGMSGPVFALTTDGSDILAGGSFRRAGRVRGDNASLWNGSGWVDMGADFDRDVLAAIHTNGEYFCAGLFNGFSGGISRHVAYYANGSWESPRGGVAAAARALALYDGEVVIGGSFVRAGGRPAERVASWNGELWNPLGAGLSDTPYALWEHGGDLIAGGRFQRAGNLEAPFLARWDGQNWFTFDSSPDDDVLVLTSLGTDLIVGGSFRNVGDLPASRIASWNGSAWRPLGRGFDGPVRALVVHGSRLVAGGSFTRADGKPASGIAFWNGLTWAPLDGGVARGDSSVHSLLSVDGRLVVGGDFELADDVVSYNLAVRNGPIPLQVWPGDCDDNGRVDGFDVLALGREWARSGPARDGGGTAWAASPAADWEPVSATFADADGSGAVDLDDLAVILANWGEDRTDGAFGDVPALPEGTAWLDVFPGEVLLSLHARLEEQIPIERELRERIERVLGWGGESPSVDSSRVGLVGSPGGRRPEILFSLSADAEVELQLLDVTGRRLARRRAELSRGDHRLSVPIPATTLGSGIYFVRVTLGDGRGGSRTSTHRWVRIR